MPSELARASSDSIGGTRDTASGRPSASRRAHAATVASSKASTPKRVAPPRLATAIGLVPATTERAATIIPPAWCRGRAATHWCPCGDPVRRANAAAAARRADPGSRTPAGRPVEPEVAVTTATSPGTGRSGMTAWRTMARYAVDPAPGSRAIAGPEPSMAAVSAGMSTSSPAGPGGTSRPMHGRLDPGAVTGWAAFMAPSG